MTDRQPHQETHGDAVAPSRSVRDADATLRQRAERRLGEHSAAVGSATPEELARLVQELRVHQVELQLQNEELRTAQTELETSRACYFGLYDLAPVGYLTLTERGLISQANLAAAKLLGAPRQALIRRPLSEWVEAEDQDDYYRCRRQVREAQPQTICELRIRRPDGSNAWIALSLSLEPASETSQARYLAVLHDIDAHKRLEALQREEAERKEDFLALLGHELRNPLAAIRNVAEVLQSSEALLPRRFVPMTAILMRQSGQLGRLVDDLLDVSRINRGRLQLARTPIDLRDCALSALEQVRAQVDAMDQRLEVDLPASPTPLNGDAVRLTQVIVNLLRNASELSPPGAPIVLALNRADDAAVIEVRDQGAGLAPESLEQIFDPVLRGSAGAGAGLGMGLALVRALVQLHGGRVEAVSPGLGQGSTFRARLPCEALRPARPPTRAAQMPCPAHRILLVEDDPDVARSCALLLEVMGQRVERAADGRSALALLEPFRPDLILLDLGLPDMDGFEVARRLRGTPSGRAARLVALTGWGQPADIARTEAAGFDAHLTKPIAQETLRQLLTGVAGGAPHDDRSAATGASHAPRR
ncbi:hybrid sensor histidine kinase/response regulator [Thiorhodococcus minor]|uniref:histidine kinase n=1 Tax=Thiorhodococcus minor TaxID=57489 RepID=A0A6M0K628_9GAMM|nr:response regulator [Thiorhodococcus minor]NEV63775.1 response regulator [Thiorhodococcus minor]